MTLDEFKATLDAGEPPAGVGPALVGLWHAAAGDWDAAHRCAQRDRSAAGHWLHAHVHRVEGDLGNARYWYRRAARPEATGRLDAEWDAMATELLAAE